MGTFFRSSRFIVVAGVFACALGSGPAEAADIWVNTTEDRMDGICGWLPVNCSLRKALNIANTTAGKDTIHLDADVYYLDIEGSVDDLGLTGDLDVLEDVDIVGAGSGLTAIQAQGEFHDRVFHVYDPPGPMPAPTLQLYDLRVSGGGWFPLDHTHPRGGGVLVDEGASLYLWRCEISGNYAYHDAGIKAELGTAVLVVDTTFKYNHTQEFNGSPAKDGGAITINGGTLLIIRSTFHDNQAAFGSAVECGGYGTVNMVNTTIANNSGDAVHINSCDTVIDSTTFAGNDPHGVWGYNLANYPWVVRNTYFGDSCSFLNTLCPVSEGGNVEAGSGCCADIENRPNMVGSLGDHGGYTQTMLPIAPYWPVVDNAGTMGYCQTEDQRGVSRPQSFPDEPHTPIACDVGAVELRDEDVVLLFSDGFESGDTGAWS